MSERADLDDLLALDLEYRLTVAVRVNADCDCARYLIGRREVLIPEVLRRAAESGTDPVDDFASFARRLHARHTPSPASPAQPNADTEEKSDG